MSKNFTYPTEELIRTKALEYAKVSVHDWENLDKNTQEWYITTITDMWKKDERVLQRVFKKQSN